MCKYMHQKTWPRMFIEVSFVIAVWVCSGCYSRTPQTDFLIKNRNQFLTVPETGKSKTGVLLDSVSGEDLPSGS